MDERFNQIIQNMLTKIGQQKSTWENYLDECVFAYNTSSHESSKFTPFELMFARKPVLAVDIHEECQTVQDLQGKKLPFTIIEYILNNSYCRYNRR